MAIRRPIGSSDAVIACDEREAFAQGSDSGETIHAAAFADGWIASRSLSSGAFARPRWFAMTVWREGVPA
jgi:hypothetical protein